MRSNCECLRVAAYVAYAILRRDPTRGALHNAIAVPRLVLLILSCVGTENVTEGTYSSSSSSISSAWDRCVRSRLFRASLKAISEALSLTKSLHFSILSQPKTAHFFELLK